jgi:hypothetical protein
MHSGKGTLILRDGRRISLTFQFGSDYDDLRSGYLICDTSGLDAGALWDRLKVSCDDGIDLVIAVVHSSDQYLAVTGRVVPQAA